MRILQIVFGVFTLYLLVVSHTVPAIENTQNGQISWLHNYKEAIELSRQTEKPILLFFTGSDWCGWCHKLEKEVFENPDFIQEMANTLIFVKLDFPMQTTLPPALTQQNKELQNKFSVHSFPSVILIDTEEHPIGVTGYRAGGGKLYARHLTKMMHEYTAFKQK